MGDITDGTSNTLFAGERPPSADFQFGWWYAGVGQQFTGSVEMLMGVLRAKCSRVTAGSCGPGSYPFGPGNTNNQCDMFHFWSLHPAADEFPLRRRHRAFPDLLRRAALPALASRASAEAVDIP